MMIALEAVASRRAAVAVQPVVEVVRARAAVLVALEAVLRVLAGAKDQEVRPVPGDPAQAKSREDHGRLRVGLIATTLRSRKDKRTGNVGKVQQPASVLR